MLWNNLSLSAYFKAKKKYINVDFIWEIQEKFCFMTDINIYWNIDIFITYIGTFFTDDLMILLLYELWYGEPVSWISWYLSPVGILSYKFALF